MRLLQLLLTGVFFTWLFHQQSFGINLVLFEAVLITMLFQHQRPNPRKPIFLIVFTGTIATLLFTLVHNTAFSIALNLLSFVTLQGLVLYPSMRSLPNAFMLAIENGFMAQVRGWGQLLPETAVKPKVFRGYFLRMLVMPVVVFSVFFAIYAFSVPGFQEVVDGFGSWVGTQFERFFGGFNFSMIMLFILGIIIGITALVRAHSHWLIEVDEGEQNELSRAEIKKQPREAFRHLLALRHEYRSAVGLLVALNVLILVVNILDIQSVWFGFEYSGGYLKQFVHAGTYMLILSIVISIFVTIWFFRKNLNFLQENRWLRWLAYAWLLQNAVMVISVMIRNAYYIEYFALAYKRIGVVFFLALTVFGLYTVFRKVHNRKTISWLVRTNMVAAYVVLVVIAAVNWDRVITEYNLSHADSAFVELEFLAEMGDHSLDLLQGEQALPADFDQKRDALFHFDREYMGSAAFQEEIDTRTAEFKERWEASDWQSWNLADHRAYEALKGS